MESFQSTNAERQSGIHPPPPPPPSAWRSLLKTGAECQSLLLIWNNISTEPRWPVRERWHLKVPNYSLVVMISNLEFLVMQMREVTIDRFHRLREEVLLHITSAVNPRNESVSRYFTLASLKKYWLEYHYVFKLLPSQHIKELLPLLFASASFRLNNIHLHTFPREESSVWLSSAAANVMKYNKNPR